MKSINIVKDARRINTRMRLAEWQDFCNLSLKQKMNIVNKRKRSLELEEEVGVKLFGGKIKST